MDGQAGLENFRQQPANLVITDILMPKVDGLETIMEFRRRFPETLIIAMSGGGKLVQRDVLKMASVLGADFIITKPFAGKELRSLVSAALASEDDSQNVVQHDG